MLQCVDERERDGHPVLVVRVVHVPPGLVLLHQAAVKEYAGIFAPFLQIRGVLDEGNADRALGEVTVGARADDLHERGSNRDRADEDVRPPAELVRGDVALDRRLRRREEHERVGVRGFQGGNLRVDVGRRDVVGLRRDDLPRAMQ